MADIIKALIEATNSDGGFLVPEIFAARLEALIQEKTTVIPDLDQVSMTSDTLHIPKVTAGTTARIIGELTTITGSAPTFGRTTLQPIKFAALVTASTEFLEDNNVAYANRIVEQMTEDLALEIENQIFNGTTSTLGFVGLRDTGSFTNSVSAGNNAVLGGTIGVIDFSNAIDEVMSDNHVSPNVTYMHSRVLGDVRNITDGSARPVFNMETFGSPLLREGVIGTIYGMGVKTANKLPINLSYGTGGSNTASDAIVGVKNQFGYYSVRRDFRLNRDFNINNDADIVQLNTRTAFNTKYPNAYCVIRDIHV